MVKKKKSNRLSFILIALGISAFAAWFNPNQIFVPARKRVPAPAPNNYVRTLPEDNQNLIFPFDLKQSGQWGTPADPYQYAVGWQQALEGLYGIKRAYPIFWRSTLYIGLEKERINGEEPDDKRVEAEVAELVKYRNDKVSQVYVTYDEQLIQLAAELFEQRKNEMAPEGFGQNLNVFEQHGKKILEVPSI